MSQIGVAVIGAGPWGGTLARTFARVPGASLRWICELDERRRVDAQGAHPSARVTADVKEVLADDAVTAAVVAVDSPRHHTVGLHVLSADRHLLVEKPLALSVTDALSLCEAAVARRRVLTVGHLLLHHPALLRAKQLLDAGALGRPLYLRSVRTAGKPTRRGGSAWWTLAPHDISSALFLFDGPPIAVSAAGSFRPDGVEDIAVFATLHFRDGRVAHIHAARMAAAGERRFSLVGADRALAFDELDARPALRLTGATNSEAGATEELPEELPIEGADPLFVQCSHFVSAVARGDLASGNGPHAVSVVRVLEAGARSMAARGTPVEVS